MEYSELEKKSALVVIEHIKKSIKNKGKLSSAWEKYLENNSRMVEIIKNVDKDFFNTLNIDGKEIYD